MSYSRLTRTAVTLAVIAQGEVRLLDIYGQLPMYSVWQYIGLKSVVVVR